MKRVLLVISLLILASPKSHAQINLVTNPSFEDNGNFQNGGIGVFGWKKPPNDGNTPDNFRNGSLTNCHPIGCLPGQHTFAGDTYAYAGERFVGVLAYYLSGGTNAREYIHQELNQELKAGHTYTIGMTIKFGGRWKYVVDRFGLFISDTAIGPTTNPALNDIIPVTPQLEMTVPFGDSANWTILSMNYTALGGEKYITIGNFTPDNLLNISINPTYLATDPSTVVGTGSYMFIDSVFIVDHDTTSANASIPELKNYLNFKLYPNPAIDVVKIAMKEGVSVDEIILFDVQGKQVRNFPPEERNFNVVGISSGEYFLQMKTEFGMVFEKLRIE